MQRRQGRSVDVERRARQPLQDWSIAVTAEPVLRASAG